MPPLDVELCFGNWVPELHVAYGDFREFENAVPLPIVPQDCCRCRTSRRQKTHSHRFARKRAPNPRK
jgi:hypothetical protein